jgi:acyl-CoA thioester hydrolase
MISRFEYRRRVSFSETDMAGIAHFANFFRYMEEAEHALFRSLGFSVHPQGESGSRTGWPRVEVQCKFRAPLRFDDEMLVEVLIARLGGKSITYHHKIWGPGEVLCAEGRVTAVCSSVDPSTGKLQSIPIPEELKSNLEEADLETES